MQASRWKVDAGNPFKATQKWNAAVNVFRVEMPVKSHRHFLRNYEDTFSGAEAATWFLSKLQSSNHFEYLSKNQVIALLDKFLKANVFEPVLADKSNEFKPNNTLYQFPSRLPLRNVALPNFTAAVPVPRAPSPVPLTRSPMKRKSSSAESLNDPKHFLVDLKAQAAKRQKNALETEKVWETILFGRLEALFDGKDIQELIPPNFINGTWIAENANYTPPASIKEYFEKNKRDFPTWVQSAMKNLSNWPSISGFGVSHTYAGFEKDVLVEIVNYFKASEKPFISWELADIFRYAYIFLETQDCDLQSSQDSLLSPTKSWTERLKSIEPVTFREELNSVTLSTESEEETPWTAPVRPASTNPFIDYTHESINMSQLVGYKLPPNTCFETAFTSESPTTRVVHTGTLKFNKLRDKRNRSRSTDNVFEPDPWQSTSHLSSLEKEMSTLSVERANRSTNPFEPCHIRSHSGGYVNLALSQSMEEEPPLEQLNMSTALASIKVLAKKAKQSRHLEESQSSNMSVASAKTTASRAVSIASGLLNAQNAKVAKKIYQLLLLLLPADSRKKLCFLLQYLGNLVANKDLKFCPEMTTKEFVVQSFCEFILGLPEGEVAGSAGINQFSKSLSCKVVSFLLEERETVLFAPADLKTEVEQQLDKFQQKEKSLPRPLRVSNVRNSVRSVASLKAAATPVKKPAVVSYCRQVSSQQFEQQKCTGSQKALQELLELIITDKKMKPKEKEKRLMTFKDAYPHIYMKRVPTKQDEDKILGLRKKASSFTKLNFLRI